MPMNEGESWDYEWDYESLPTSKIDRWREKEVGSSPVYFIEVNPGTDPVGSGPVAQGIRARGYEPRCRGFESLLARNQSSPRRNLPPIFGSCILPREESACNFGSYTEDSYRVDKYIFLIYCSVNNLLF